MYNSIELVKWCLTSFQSSSNKDFDFCFQTMFSPSSRGQRRSLPLMTAALTKPLEFQRTLTTWTEWWHSDNMKKKGVHKLWLVVKMVSAVLVCTWLKGKMKRGRFVCPPWPLNEDGYQILCCGRWTLSADMLLWWNKRREAPTISGCERVP